MDVRKISERNTKLTETLPSLNIYERGSRLASLGRDLILHLRKSHLYYSMEQRVLTAYHLYANGAVE